MTDSSPIIKAQLARLLEVVEEFQKEECAKLHADARLEAKATIGQAFHDARLRVNQDVDSIRLSIEQAMATARARVQTEEKQHQYLAIRDYLDQSWRQLKELLKQRWKSTETRGRWLDKAVNQALQVLPKSTWKIEHPNDWPEDERQTLSAQLTTHSRPPPEFSGTQDLTEGIRITADNATVDASIEGLLADRARIEAEFLARHPALMTKK